jgi:hypothetical protein
MRTDVPSLTNQYPWILLLVVPAAGWLYLIVARRRQCLRYNIALDEMVKSNNPKERIRGIAILTGSAGLNPDMTRDTLEYLANNDPDDEVKQKAREAHNEVVRSIKWIKDMLL